MISRKREITIEVEKVRVVSNLKKSKSNCENCAGETEFISLSNALEIFSISEGTIAQMALARSLHLKLSGEGEILVCLPSLLLANNCVQNLP